MARPERTVRVFVLGGDFFTHAIDVASGLEGLCDWIGLGGWGRAGAKSTIDNRNKPEITCLGLNIVLHGSRLACGLAFERCEKSSFICSPFSLW